MSRLALYIQAFDPTRNTPPPSLVTDRADNGKLPHFCTNHGPMKTNQETLAELIERAGITRAQAAKYITEETKRPCSWRAVQSWLTDPSLSSARSCPNWAVANLEAYLTRQKLLA